MASKARRTIVATSEPGKTAVLYARVSSKEQEQGFSIAAQIRLLHEYANARSLLVTQEFVDVETAKRAGRTAFNELIEFVRKTGVRIILVEKTDRLYRNLRDYVTLDELELEIHLVKENAVLSSESRSTDKFMHGIKVLMAKNYIDNLSEETLKGMLEKARNGIWPSFAPIGYKNTVDTAGRRVIAPHEAEADVVRQLFAWFVTGDYSLSTLASKARKEGLATGRTKLPKSEVHNILRKRIYTGDFDWNGATYKGSHEPLIARDLWLRVQELLDGKSQSRQQKHAFTYSGIVTCGHCGCAMVAEMKKGRYVYYHCTGGKGVRCGEKYTREERLTKELAAALEEIAIPKEITDWLRAALRESDLTEKRAREQSLKQIQLEIERMDQRIETMYLDKLDGRITPQFFDEKAAAWRQEQGKMRQRLASLRDAPSDFGESIGQIEQTSTLCRMFPSQPLEEKRRVLRLLIHRASWKDGRLETTLREPFQQLRLSNSASRRKQEGKGDFGASIADWLPDMDSNHDSRLQRPLSYL